MERDGIENSNNPRASCRLENFHAEIAFTHIFPFLFSLSLSFFLNFFTDELKNDGQKDGKIEEIIQVFPSMRQSIQSTYAKEKAY